MMLDVSEHSGARDAGHAVFAELLDRAEERLSAAWEEAASIEHRGLRGGGREVAVREFLTGQLPERFCVTKGEALDTQGNRSSELDLVIYDKLKVRPLLEQGGVALLPAEALLATVEVRSVVNKDAARAYAAAGTRLRLLRPYGGAFRSPRAGGEGADDLLPRIQTHLFGRSSDLAPATWAEKEIERVRACAREADCPIDALDRVVVLDRGLVQPAAGEALPRTAAGGVLRVWFFHLVNFLVREADRRPSFPWGQYSDRVGADNWEQAARPLVRGRNQPARKRSTAKPSAGAKQERSGGRRRQRRAPRDGRK